MHGETVRSLITFNGLANLPNPTLRFNQCCLMATATGRCNDGRLVKQQQHHQQKHLFLLCNMKSFVQFFGKLARQLIERISIGSNVDNEVFSRHHRPKNGGNCIAIYTVGEFVLHAHNFWNAITSLFCLNVRIEEIRRNSGVFCFNWLQIGRCMLDSGLFCSWIPFFLLCAKRTSDSEKSLAWSICCGLSAFERLY